MDTVKDTLGGLNSEAESEAAKFGEDVKYLADFTNGVKKFEPWINASEETVKKGLGKPNSLNEANAMLKECQVLLSKSFNSLPFSKITLSFIKKSLYVITQCDLASSACL